MKFLSLLCLVCVLLIAGCSTESVTHVATGTVSFAGKVASKTAITAVKTSAEIASSTTRTVVKTSAHVVKSVAMSGFITVRDTAIGITRQVPYSEGLRLYAASQTAKISIALKAVQLIRSGTTVMNARGAQIKLGTYSDPLLHPGDVIQLSSMASIKISKMVKHS